MKKLASLAAVAIASMLATGCTWLDVASNENFNGLKDMHGNSVTHMNCYKLGLNFFFTIPMMNEASLNATTAHLSSAAKAQGNTKMRIVQSDSSSWWWLIPPFSFIFTPVSGYVAADVSK